jgi:hypothetical protein
MPKLKKTTTKSSSEKLSKQELEELKLKKEIDKLNAEIKEKEKPWVLKNVGVLLPSFLGVGTLLTGVFSGYFNVESIRLENQKHDLKQEVLAFIEKKDSLNTENIKLQSQNRSYTNKFQFLLSKGQADSIKAENEIKEQQRNLEDISFKLSIKKKELEIAEILTPIKTIASQLIDRGNDLDLMNEHSLITNLVVLIKKSKENKSAWDSITKIIEINSNLIITKTAILSAAFLATEDKNYKQELYAFIKKDFEKNFTNILSNDFSFGERVRKFSNIFQLSLWNKKDRIENISFFSDLILKTKPKNIFDAQNLSDILFYVSVSSLQPDRFSVNQGQNKSWCFVPSENTEVFLAYLKTYRHLNSNEFSPFLNQANVLLFSEKTPYFVYYANGIVNYYENNQNIMPNFDSFTPQWVREREDLKNSIYNKIGANYLTDIKLWKKWLQDNESLNDRMMEKDFSIYSKDTSLMNKDFKAF